MDFTSLHGLQCRHASHAPSYDGREILLSPEVCSGQKNGRIAASHGNFLSDRLAIAREPDADCTAGQLPVCFGDIAVGRDGEGELLAQIGDRPHDRSLSNGGDFDADRLSARLSLGEMADQRALNNVLGRDKAEQVFHMAGQYRGQPKGHSCRRQIEV